MKYGLIGAKLGHSFSKRIHGLFGIDDYELKELPEQEIGEFLLRADFAGINVTIPYKQTVMKYIEVDAVARDIGSVNTIVNRNGQLYGYNTDYLGFIYMVRRAHIDCADKKIVILGSGGTAKTACYAMAELGAAQITVLSRSNLRFMIRAKVQPRFATYEEKEKYTDADIIVNTTPVGMFPNNDDMPTNPDAYENLAAVVDVIYNPLRTKLTQKAEQRNLQWTNGLPMLVAQAWFAQKHFFDEYIMSTCENAQTVRIDTVNETKIQYVMSTEEENQMEAVIRQVEREEQNLCLIGMPGVGKSTIGAMLANKLQREFVDTDVLFEETVHIRPGDCIIDHGEAEFRKKESEIIQSIAGRTKLVIATGGGSLLLKENRDRLHQNATFIFLQKNYLQLATEGRPLSSSAEELKALYYERLPIYVNAANVTIPVLPNAEDTLALVMEAIENPIKNTKRFLVLNGPNLNMLGIREPEIYGHETYADLIRLLKREAKDRDVKVCFYQSNHEGELVEAIQNAYGSYDGIIINPGAYTHTSIALADALKAVHIPTVEVHISAVEQREEFRSVSYIRKECVTMISGEGLQGYVSAMDVLLGSSDSGCELV